MGWKVFLPDVYIPRVENKIHEIASDIVSLDVNNGGLMGGAAGLACFYAYYADWTGSLQYDQLAAGMIEHSLNPASGLLPDYRFSDGLTGTSWLIHELVNAGLIELDASEIYKQIDPHIQQAMRSDIAHGNVDFLHGALGMGLYFLRKPETPEYRAALSGLVEGLKGLSESEADGSMKWKSLLDADQGLMGYNLSLSHGISSIIIILSQIMEKGIAEDDCREMIRGAIQYLERQRLNSQLHQSSFPSWAIESMNELHDSRLAWCYGDLGIGLAYLSAGKQFPHQAYSQDGMDILLRTTQRRDLSENSVVDAGLCHGAAGITMIYNSLYQSTEMLAFKDAASYWLDVCLNMATHKDGIAGYKSWYSPGYGGWKVSGGLLDGVAGIALSLLSFVMEKEPSWTKSLLIR